MQLGVLFVMCTAGCYHEHTVKAKQDHAVVYRNIACCKPDTWMCNMLPASLSRTRQPWPYSLSMQKIRNMTVSTAFDTKNRGQHHLSLCQDPVPFVMRIHSMLAVTEGAGKAVTWAGVSAIDGEGLARACLSIRKNTDIVAIHS